MKDGGPAFPSHGSMGEVRHEGMSLRDYFATAALSLIGQARGVAIFGSKGTGLDIEFVSPQNIAAEVYRLADAMLAERDK